MQVWHTLAVFSGEIAETVEVQKAKRGGSSWNKSEWKTLEPIVFIKWARASPKTGWPLAPI